MSSAPNPPPRPPKPASSTTSKITSSSNKATDDTEINDIVNGGTSTYQVSSSAIKNVSELLSADADDESLRKYKESLLGSAAQGDVGDSSDPRKLIVEEFRIIFAPEESRSDVVYNLSTDQGVAALAAEGITMVEGCKFKFSISFRVQHEIIAGIRFINSVERMMVKEKEELMIGSYPPSSKPQQFEFPKWGYNEAPKGMMYRGKYRVKNYFIDSDKNKYLEFTYELHIVKK